MIERTSAVCACRTGVRVLLAADDDSSRQWLCETLHTDGHDVHLVSSRDELSELASDPNDDHEMALVVVTPFVDHAIDLVRTLRDVDVSSPAIVVAPTMSDSERSETNRLGAIAFDAAVDLQDLLTIIRNLGTVVSQRRVRWA